MKLIYYIIHYFTGCPRKHQVWNKDKKATCSKCGRDYFNFIIY